MVAIERFIEYLDAKGLRITPIEKQLGFSNGYLGKMRNRKASVGSEVLEKIVCMFPDMNVEWLITGKGEMLKPGLDDEKPPPEKVEYLEREIEIINNLNTFLKEQVEHKDKQIDRLTHIIELLENDLKTKGALAKTLGESYTAPEKSAVVKT